MPLNVILYIVTIMIVYDFSLHVYDLLIEYRRIKARHPLGAYKIFNYFSKGDTKTRRKVYQIFWTTYWGIAFLLMAVYLLTSL